MTLGVHFALSDPQAEQLLAADGDDEVMALVEEIEEEWLDVTHCDTDKAWDAIHRSLTDGWLEFENGEYPFNAMILGGTQLYGEDDYIVSYLNPGQVRDVAEAVADLDRAEFHARYHAIEVEDYGPEFGDDDFSYTWDNFVDLRSFFEAAARDGRHVIFTAAQ